MPEIQWKDGMDVMIPILVLAFFLQKDPSSLSDQAQQQAQQKHYGDAERLWRQAMAIDPGFFPALFNLGFMKTTVGAWEDARPLLERAAKVQPRDFNTRFLLGQVLMRLDRRDDALREWRQALAVQPRNVRLMKIMIIEFEKGRYFIEAEQLAKRALELDPEDLNLYFLAIHACQSARDLESGLALARVTTAKFPDSARAHFELGFHLQRNGQRKDAVEHLLTAMKLDPGYDDPFFFYGDLLASEGKNEEGITYLEEAIRIRPGFAPAHVSMAKALMHLDRWGEARLELEAAIQSDPANPEPHLLLSRIHFRLGDETRAAKEKEISLRLRRENPNALEAIQGRPFPK